MDEKEKKRKLLSILVESQETTSSITLSIGGTSSDGHVMNNVICIKDCPPATIDAIKSHDEFKLSMDSDNGLMIEFY